MSTNCLDLVIKNAAFTKGIGQTLPVSDGLLAFSLFGDSLGLDFADTGAVPSVVGSPARTGAFTSSCNANAYVDTGIKPSQNYTVIAVAKIFQATAGLVTTHAYSKDSLVYRGHGLLMQGTPSETMVTGTYDGTEADTPGVTVTFINATNGAIPTSAAAAEWRCITSRLDWAGTLGTAKRAIINDLTKGVSAASTITANAVDLRADVTFRAGSTYPGAAQTVNQEMMAYAIYNRPLTSDELQSVYKTLQAIGAKASIVF